MAPHECGRRLLPAIVDQVAKQSPGKTYAQYPDRDWQRKGYRNLCFGQVAKAVDKMAFWLDENLGIAKNFETFAYYGSKDLRYAFVVLAAIKTGRKAS
jgi:acyl-coenzyme A synthetase/AMP-(fatty) acid ligase